jgi:hypothetical protein
MNLEIIGLLLFLAILLVGELKHTKGMTKLKEMHGKIEGIGNQKVDA